MSGLMNLFHDEKLCVIEDAYSDILFVEGIHSKICLASEKLIYDGDVEPINTLKLVMEVAKIYKNIIDKQISIFLK